MSKQSDRFPIIKSDDLKQLRRFIEISSENLPNLNDHQLVFQTIVIPDVNRVLDELHFRIEGRNQENARTSFQEALDAETVIPAAPEHLKDEMRKKIPNFAAKEDLPQKSLWKHWKKLRSKITFYDVSERVEKINNDVCDPDDLPYVVLQQEIGGPIYSQDSHITSLGGITLTREGMIALRDYSRKESVRMHILCGSTAVAEFGMLSVSGIFYCIKMLLDLFKQLPFWVKCLLVAGGGYALSFPKVREKIGDFGSEISDKTLLIARKVLLDGFIPIAEKLNQSWNETNKNLEKFNSNLQMSNCDVPYMSSKKEVPHFK